MHVIVVGGGTAGCVVASRLARRADIDVAVTLVEQGVADGTRQGRSSLADQTGRDSRHHAIWARFASETDANDAQIEYLQGDGLGGSSRINGAIVAAADREAVAATGLPLETVVASEFGPIDRALDAASVDGLTVAPVTLARRDSQLVSTAALLGIEHVTLRHATVDAIVIGGGVATGVMTTDGEMIPGDAVVVCAGALQTPLLLRRSGIETVGRLADHPSFTVELAYADGDAWDTDDLVTGVVGQRDGIEIVPLNHCGPAAPGRAAFVVGVLDAAIHGTVSDDGGAVVRFDQSPATQQRLAAAHRLVDELLATESVGEIVAVDSVGRRNGGMFHACGSVRDVVDDHGAVRGVERLWVADAAALELPDRGPYGAVVAAADRLAAAVGL